MCTMFILGNHKNTEEYTQFMMTHEAECLINHRSSASKMECDGIVDCFVSSVGTRSLCYTEYHLMVTQSHML